ncbi:aspartate aminotransferase family protein [Pseudopedobacter beijingensis]|uniref:Aspartate aminotransferase family protein n=1 Tax=Pseudopedobacter beijingensis TaxID=1207056 RepID=A0ABW4II46_9SPHI
MDLFDVYARTDVGIVKGIGSHIWDERGQKYLDLFGGHAVISIGHTHPHYVKRLTSQLNNLGFYSNSVKIPVQQQLAEKIGHISGKTDYSLFLCNSGAEANENALKLASFANGRKKIISFKNAFHGRTSLTVAATDNPNIIAPVNETDNVIFLPHNDIDALQNTFAQHGREISSVIVEGIQGVGGIRVSDLHFLATIRWLCNKYGAYFIADSIQCGYGRSGLFFAHDYARVNADIYTIAKGMGNGFPIGGLLISPKLKPEQGMLGTTFGGNPLACAAALAVIEIMEQDKLIDNAAMVGNYLLQELKEIKTIQEVRGKGLMIGIELPPEFSNTRTNLIHKHYIFTGEAKPNIIRLLPALNISFKEADVFLKALKTELK